MQPTPDLSILLLTYRDGAKLLKTLRHFAGFTSFLKLEFVVINVLDTLSEAELRSIEALQPAVSLRIFSSRENHLARNRNEACRQAAADDVLFLDADAELHPVELEKLWIEWRSLKTTVENLAGLGGANLPPQDEPFYRLQTDYQRLWLGHLGSPQLWIPGKMRRVPYLSTVFSIFKKSAILNAGGFRQSYSKVCEDQELGVRLARRGKIFYLSPHAQVIHRSENTWKGWIRRVFRFGTGQPAVMFDHPRSWLSLKAFALVFSFSLAMGSLYARSWKPLEWAFLVYFLLLLVDLRMLGRKRRSSPLFLMLFCGLNHFAYGLGLYVGLFKAIYQRFGNVSDLSQEIVTEMT